MDVRLAARSDIPALAQVLAAAFEIDPFSRWLFGEDERLRERLRVSFRALLRAAYLPKGHTYTTDDLAGAALWAPPGRWKLTVSQQLRLAPSFLRVLGPRRLSRAGPAGRAIDAAHPVLPHWHLSVLGVAPERQRSGIGAALMRPILERADREGVLAHLETSRAENVPYYVRYGFEVAREFDVPGGGPHMWTMSRRPGTAL